jgi:hypothetical protein
MRGRVAISGAVAVAALAGGLLMARPSTAEAPKPAAVFTADGKMEFPKDYRRWIYLSSGFDMSYAEGGGGMGDQHMFDNVFVDPAAYDAFLKTGHWPEGTVFMLEVRMGSGKGSINKAGQFQTIRAGAEAHIKDKRFPSGWAFVGFRGEAPGTALPQTSACNVCHEAHGAVDTTFVQFYPTLMPLAREKKTLSAAYLAEENAR